MLVVVAELLSQHLVLNIQIFWQDEQRVSWLKVCGSLRILYKCQQAAHNTHMSFCCPAVCHTAVFLLLQANQILGMAPGEIFVQRNVGNQAMHTDLNLMACLEYAVKSLKVCARSNIKNNVIVERLEHVHHRVCMAPAGLWPAGCCALMASAAGKEHDGLCMPSANLS
jgi:hypothetical protein